MEIILVQIQGQKNPKSPHPPHAPPGKLSATIGVDRGYPAPDTWHHATPSMAGRTPFLPQEEGRVNRKLQNEEKK